MNNLPLKKSMSRLAIAITLGSSVLVASETVNADPAIYIGAAYGFSRVNKSDFDDKSTAVKAFVGFKFGDYIGIEGAVNDYGKSVNGLFSAELTGNTGAVVGFLPLTDSFELFAKGGKVYWRDKVEAMGIFRKTFSGDDVFIGLGMDFKFNPALALRLEMERYTVDIGQKGIDGSFDVDVASVGGVFTF